MNENMSDLWTASSATPPPIMHHSSLSQSLPPLDSFSFSNHGNPPPAKVTSPHLPPQTQFSSFQFPHLSHSQVSPHPSQSKVTSPHLSQQIQEPSSDLFYQSQMTSPHLHSLPVNSPHNFAPPPLNSPLLPNPHVPSPSLVSQHQHLLYNQNPDPELDLTSWTKPEGSSDLSYLLNGGSFSYQPNQAVHLDLHLQNQNQFSIGGTHHKEDLENPYRPYDSGMFGQNDVHGPGQHTWSPVVQTLSQVQYPPLGSSSAGGTDERWGSIEDFPNNHFFSEGHHDNNSQQPFCSPATPGSSPHYPQTPSVSSPGPQMHPRTDRTVFKKQTSQLNRNPSLGYCLNKPNSYLMVSDPGQQHPQTSQRHLVSQTELSEDRSGLLKAADRPVASPRERRPNVSSAGPTLGPTPGPTPGLPAGLTCKKEGGGKGRGSRKEENQQDWTWVKQMQPDRGPGLLDSRLLCVVCNRDFKSLPALNGHMRSHSGFRSPTRLKKDTPPPVPSPVSMVMPVSVPVLTRGTSGQRRSDVFPPAIGGRLYRSLMRLEEAAGLSPYTPPPMLCPHRSGPGLYCSLTTRGQQRALTIQLHNELGDPVAMTTACPAPRSPTSGIIKPRINVGRSFQAEIPSVRDKRRAQADSHNALLLWTPYDELERPVSQQRVEALLMMARSSVVPGPGAGPEYALQLLSKCRGDFLLTVEKLLAPPETSNKQTGVEGVRWSAAEKKLLMKSLQLHQKDFSRIQRAVQSKSLSECVEFYYLWKKKLSLNTKTRTDLSVTLPAVQRVSTCQEAS